MRRKRHLLYLLLLLPAMLAAQQPGVMSLPRQELLPTGKVNHVMQDGEGYVWYATEGGGVCRDDGHDVSVFRSDAAHPDLLGNNNISCLAEAGHHIVIGSFHGAYVLDKRDYTIRHLTEVDDKRVDDILVTRSGNVLLTANRKIYQFDAQLQCTAVHSSAGKYVARLFEDSSGRIWATQWNGGLLCMKNDAPAAQATFEEMAWTLQVFPTAMADAGDGCLWIGTAGQGVVRYLPENETAVQQDQTGQSVCTDLLTSADGHHLWVSTTEGLQLFEATAQLMALQTDSLPRHPTRLSKDIRGCLLVACSEGQPMAIGTNAPWPVATELTTATADSLRDARRLTTRPAAYALSAHEELWFSTGHDIRHQRRASDTEEVVMPTKDVKAMAFAPDGTLWMGTIFGVLYAYNDGLLTTDDYASNEHGDAILALSTDSAGVLTIAYEHYCRRYDPQRHTLRQQSTEVDGTYRVELQETAPHQHWSQPASATAFEERLPQWTWWLLGLLTATLLALVGYIWFLKLQRKKFLKEIKSGSQPAPPRTRTAERNEQTDSEAPWLQKAIAQVEAHLSDDSYSVELLSKDLCMSRMTFYRKIQTATGQKPTEFMRTIRLRHAADLLQRGNLTIKEISFATGFSSVSYFSRCFRTMYGVSPTQYGSLTTAEERPDREMPNSDDERHPT